MSLFNLPYAHGDGANIYQTEAGNGMQQIDILGETMEQHITTLCYEHAYVQLAHTDGKR